jgi:hypothetical protein
VLSNTSGFAVMHSPAPGPLGSRGVVSADASPGRAQQQVATSG